MSIKLNIQENIPLAPLTTFKIGGSARFFCEVSGEEELAAAVNYAKENKLAVFVLGGGSNILVNDNGFDGLVIKVQGSKFKIQNSSIECGAGLSLSKIVGLAKENSLSGLAWAAGIPGSLGGAVRGNAGAYGGEIKDIVESVKVLEMTKTQDTRYKQVPNDKSQIPNKFQNKNFKILKNGECDFSYRSSIFKQDPNLLVVSCVLKLEKGNPEEISAQMKEVIGKRAKKLPTEPSPGSFFQNPTVTDNDLIASFEKDMETTCRENKIPAGWLIDEAGLRGKSIGGARVSDKHANFVINTGGATAQDVITLASLIKMKVRDELGVQLKEEVQYVGF